MKFRSCVQKQKEFIDAFLMFISCLFLEKSKSTKISTQNTKKKKRRQLTDKSHTCKMQNIEYWNRSQDKSYCFDNCKIIHVLYLLKTILASSITYLEYKMEKILNKS